MADIDVEIGSIKYRGTMDVNNVVSAVEDWLNDHDYSVAETKRSHKSDEIEIKLEADKKVHEYIKVEAVVELKFRDLQDVELIRHGQKEKMQDGYCDVEISGTVKLDPYKRFKGSDLLQKMGDFVNDYILKKDINDTWKNKHYYELLDLHRTVKEVLEFETPVSAR